MTTPDQTKQPVPKLALTREEAAEALGLSVKTIDRLTAEGKLKPNRATRRPLYSRADLERFLACGVSNP